jgi:uncharacterized cupredoxin-like copper-binding protein
MINTNKLVKAIAISAFSATIVLGATKAWASGSHGGSHGKMMSVGEPGKAGKASRTIEIKMFDNYYEPENISVKAGETVRFVIKNAGDFVHEFNIGTSAMHTAHQKEMMMMVEHGALMPDKINHHMMKMDMGGGKTMEHNDPNSVLLEPGKSGEVVWTFSKAGKIEFACNVPGHYDAGMMGLINFK